MNPSFSVTAEVMQFAVGKSSACNMSSPMNITATKRPSSCLDIARPWPMEFGNNQKPNSCRVSVSGSKRAPISFFEIVSELDASRLPRRPTPLSANINIVTAIVSILHYSSVVGIVATPEARLCDEVFISSLFISESLLGPIRYPHRK